jgi:quinol-cytochrome oxidoreductase complex cytochrome b subunit
MLAQLTSGLFLSALLAYRLGHTYHEILDLLHEGFLTFLLRDIHMLGANTLALVLYLHAGKAAHARLTSIVRLSIWITGSALFLLLLAACFTGYVLVNGNMSYWALVVILNIVTVLPLLDSPIVATLLSSTVPTDTSVHRMFTLHYLLALLFAAIMFLHLTYVHRLRPGSTHNQNIRAYQLADVLIKDLILVLPMVMVFSFPSISRVIHPDN